MHSPYLERKDIDLADLQQVCASKVDVASSRVALFEDDQFKAYHHGDFVFRDLVSLTMENMGTERILDQRVDRFGQGKPNDKFVTSGSDTSGFTPMGFDPRSIMRMEGRMIVCAGLAEGYRIHQATGFPVACAVGEANIPKISQQMASLTRPNKLRISVAVDNDKAGRMAAYRSGLPFTMPRQEKDFSDVYQNENGLDDVRWQAEWDFPPLEPEERDRQLDIMSGRSNEVYKPPMNRLEMSCVGSAPMGVVGCMEIVKPHLIDGYDQFKAVAESMDAGPIEQEGYDQWALHSPEELGLVMGMMDAGLHTSLQSIPLELTTLETNFFEAIHEGMVDDIPIPGGVPALVNFGEDDRGQCLVVKTPYDKQIAELCREARGFYDKEADEWRISVTTPEKCERALDALTDNPLRRFMFPDQNDDERWVVATPWTREDLADQMPALSEPGAPTPDVSQTPSPTGASL